MFGLVVDALARLRRFGGSLSTRWITTSLRRFGRIRRRASVAACLYALFEAGDGHAGQGNGEVDITALETYLTGTFRFIVHKDRHLLWPRAETPDSYISMGFSKDLKEATEHAVRDMIEFLMEAKHLSRDDAYMLVSVAVDVDITQLVDGNVGVHAICPKKIFTTR